jgi:Zn finger protein HypA/HybF involved in hydrogenase expression
MGEYTYHGIRLIFDGITYKGRSSPLRICIQCGQKDRIFPSTANHIKNGRLKGYCRKCASKNVGKANSGRIKLKSDQVLPDKSIIHWSTRTSPRKVEVTCGKCEKKRLTVVQVKYRETGLCLSCFNSVRILEKHPGWKGGRQKDDDGYILVHIELYSNEEKELLHPMVRKSGYILEHRAVMALSLNRSLKKNEIVHHKNGVKNDNRLENLQLTTPQDHANDEIRSLQKEIERLKKLLSQT